MRELKRHLGQAAKFRLITPTCRQVARAPRHDEGGDARIAVNVVH
jgi:hypothetical protein